ncbi:hypothetical protein E2493_06920 [Sphingomonas parva]|uniref:2OG-Fe(II) oxygenase n=1 Tax=Sphingomonas parva TaxID=2555898 RepID=A0A4Y8ZSI5_9SPHN|nr:DUF6445 family protein [Sphingomonas parva]TFI58980.1 hypothetical protein E2493_06920 [Sphingomonas parva]
MVLEENLFAISPHATARFELLAGVVPVVIVDNFYAQPEAIREVALGLSYAPPPYPYPGRVASIPEPNRSLAAVRADVLRLVNDHYLPRVPLIQHEGGRLSSIRQLHTDFAVVDVHPDALHPVQQLPHVDPVPIFGLVYLNPEPRGGTLFFNQKGPAIAPSGQGYPVSGNESFELLDRIAPAYNRMAIYPGFVPHSAEIDGDWIRGEARFSSPRLTQRFVFLP